ncbi:transmembrane emp24 domain-containing protein 1-like [Tubulanus polymorphus]|uniref:transmembrane emp24 domain-containing protein 1-like n=1 Tax=Tubulanus polymorphus TaxID=672921 RepID=UPI003DA42AFC
MKMLLLGRRVDSMLLVQLVVALLVMVIGIASGKDREMTVDVAAGEKYCFFHTVNDREGAEFDVEYQVIEGGEMDVNFILNSPSGAVLVSEKKKTDGTHKTIPNEVGDYRFCFDNSFSRFSSKLVFFDLTTNEEDETKDWSKITVEDTLVDMRLEDFRMSMDKVKKSLEKASKIQDILRVFELRDRSVQESNFDRVNTWSVIQIAVMVTVAIIQVIMVRSLLDDKSTFHRMFAQEKIQSTLRT